MTPRYIIIVTNPDGDIIAAVTPNPVFPEDSCKVLERLNPDLQTELVQVMSIDEFVEYEEETT